MYPDSILFIILPVALYAGLVFVPHHIGWRASGIALGATAVFLLASISMQNSPSFDFSKEYQSSFAVGLFGATAGAFSFHFVAGTAPGDGSGARSAWASVLA